MEMEYQLLLASDYSIMSKGNWRTLTDQTVIVRKMLYNLRKRVLEADAGDK